MKKCLIGTLAATGLVWLAIQVMPDIKRYLRIRCM
ncbi:DUF6893 family small protein [Kitasatospora sp. NPDC050467]